VVDPGYRLEYLGFGLLSSADAEPNEMVEVSVAEQSPGSSCLDATEEFWLHDK